MDKLLQDIRIMPKVMALMGLLALVALGLAWQGSVRIGDLEGRYSTLVQNHSPATLSMARANRASSESALAAFQVATAAPGSRAAELAAEAVDAARDHGHEYFAQAVKADPDLSADIGPITAAFDRTARLAAETRSLAAAGRTDEALRRAIDAQQAANDFTSLAKPLNDRRTKADDATSAALRADGESGARTALVVAALVAAATLALAYWAVKSSVVDPILRLEGRMRTLASGDRSIEVPCAVRKDELGAMARALVIFRDAAREQAEMQKAKEQADAEQRSVVETLGVHLDRLSAGDLTATIDREFPDAYGALKTNFNAAISSLAGLIATVAESAAQIRTGSREIAQASEDLARRTEGNAASLEQTSAAIAQMDGRLKATAGAAQETVQRADQTINVVSGGRSVADEAVQAMGRVSESAKGIDSVIEGLDKIAFQTRVLAMNAAVEAGRAGEAGRGFAVVADLVSALAMRAEEEAKRARDQLTVTQTDIVSAVNAVEKVDEALQAISSDVGEVHALLATIADDNKAQAQAITEVNSSIASMDQATQQNAAMVEETSAAARSLTTEVNSLADKASSFTVSDTLRSPAAARPAPARAAPKTERYLSPVKPLPVEAVAALTRPDDDWTDF